MDTGDHTAKGERELIRRIAEQLRAGHPDDGLPHAGRTGVPRPPAGGPLVPFGDDMAPIDTVDPTLLWTTDMLMDGVDFDSLRHDWADIGRKAMAANLSDCAAMAVRPVAALCAVALNNRLSMDEALELFRGANEMGRRYGCELRGGDTNSWDAPTVIAISVAARADAPFPPVRRDGARPGDRLFLTGPVGGSILGRHLRFQPRVDVALRINRELRPHAMIDISDGLALDLSRILEASGVGARIDAGALDRAIHADAMALAAQDGRPAREHALNDGEDFELIVVVAPDRATAAARHPGLLPLGEITAGGGLVLVEADGRSAPLEPRGWEHFR